MHPIYLSWFFAAILGGTLFGSIYQTWPMTFIGGASVSALAFFCYVAAARLS